MFDFDESIAVKGFTSVIRLAPRQQRTLARCVTLDGVGFITGSRVRLRLVPAAEHLGIQLVRTDVLPQRTILAHTSAVTGTARRTTLGHEPHQVTLVEHLLSALAALRVDNCRIELDGPEPPGLDGSAFAFVELIHSAGIVTQSATKERWTVAEPMTVRQAGACISLHPSDDDMLRISYLLDYGAFSAIPPQIHTVVVTPENYAEKIARCRTFVLESEAKALRQAGIGPHLTTKDIVVFGPQGPIDNPLRYADEPARHKILDVIGDLALCGVDLVGHVVAYRSGHPLNVELARTIASHGVSEFLGNSESPPIRRVA